MRNIDISVSTVFRAGGYLNATIKSFDRDVPISLVVGSPLNSYLEAYNNNPRYKIVKFSESEWFYISQKAVRQRACWNYWRCLSLARKHANGSLVFEDDIEAAKGWWRYFEATVDQIEAAHGQQYVLSLYSAHPGGKSKNRLLFESYPTHRFFGTQGMYFPEPVITGYAAYLFEFGVRSYHKPYDLLLAEYLMFKNIRLFSTVPSLVQHLGTRTTGLGEFHHRSPSFLSELPPVY